MYGQKLILKTFVVCLISLIVVTAAYAETKTISDTTGYTNQVGQQVKSRTTSAYQMNSLTVHLRVWGQCCPTLKDQQSNTKLNGTATSIVTVAWGYNTTSYPCQHSSRIYPGGSTTVFYTSWQALASSYYCWSGGSCY